ncbi:hypothetical protein NGM37_26895, partial [Streptomyces sp. TRM76130]|nr:hypothetical protein [Streptomyces sp. TRM76130]
SRSGSDLLLAARPAPQVELVRIAADAIWLSGVYIVCTVFTWIPTLGAPGGPWPEYVLFGLSGIVLALALGHIAGRVVPSRFTAAVAAIGGFLLFTLVFDSQSSPLTSIAFYHSIDVRLSATHLVWRVVICLLTVAAMSTADSLARRAARTRGSAGAGGLVFGITLVCVLVMPGSGS